MSKYDITKLTDAFLEKARKDYNKSVETKRTGFNAVENTLRLSKPNAVGKPDDFYPQVLPRNTVGAVMHMVRRGGQYWYDRQEHFDRTGSVASWSHIVRSRRARRVKELHDQNPKANVSKMIGSSNCMPPAYRHIRLYTFYTEKRREFDDLCVLQGLGGDEILRIMRAKHPDLYDRGFKPGNDGIVRLTQEKLSVTKASTSKRP